MFIGLGCDVAALKSLVNSKGIDASNLFTVDLICFGPTFQEVNRQYVEALERKYKSKIIDFTVRGKKRGWTPPYIIAKFANGKEFYTDFYRSDYGKAFSLYTRSSCYNCHFRGNNHQADITVGDYWGLTHNMTGYNRNGVSIFIVKTPRGKELLQKIDVKEFSLQPADVDFAMKHNHMYFETRKKPGDYEKFFADLKSVGLHKAVLKHYGVLKYYFSPVKKYVAIILPVPVKEFIKKFLLR